MAASNINRVILTGNLTFDPELRSRGIQALHLQVRPENPALRLYQRSGFAVSPRVVMTRRL